MRGRLSGRMSLVEIGCLPAAGAGTELAHLYAEPLAPSLSTLLSRHGQPTSRAWCLRRNNTVEGVAWFSVVADQAELLDIRVAPTSRSTGLGRQLLDYAKAQLVAEGVRECFLEVRESNRTAQRLYARLGWVSVGRRSNYYTAKVGREDALLMTLNMTREFG